MTEKKQQPAEPIRLRTAAIIDGAYYREGEPLPFVSENEVPPNLRHLIASDADAEGPPPFDPAERNFYSPHLRRQARAVRGNIQFQDWAEQEVEAAGKLPPETEEALQAAHDKAIGLVKAQAKFNQEAADNAYESAVRQAEEVQTQYFVRRGGEMARVERAKLKPGETCFVKRPNGEYEASGFIDANGTWPEPEIYP